MSHKATKNEQTANAAERDGKVVVLLRLRRHGQSPLELGLSEEFSSADYQRMSYLTIKAGRFDREHRQKHGRPIAYRRLRAVLKVSHPVARELWRLVCTEDELAQES